VIRRLLDRLQRRPSPTPSAPWEAFEPVPGPDLAGDDGAPLPRRLCLGRQWLRAGDARWRRALEALGALHAPAAVPFDGHVEATFAADPDALHGKPWVGVVHGDGDLEALLGDERFARSANHCVGLFAFAPEVCDALAARFAFPVSRLPAPDDPVAFARAVAASPVYAAIAPTPVASFLLFAHSRTGSTTLQRILETHPHVRMLSEPFNPMVPKNNPQGRHAYLYESEDDERLGRCLDEMFHYFTGVRHLMPGRPPEGRVKRWDIEHLNRVILRRPLNRILLVRRNRLQSVVSVMLSMQTRVWQRDQGRHEQGFEPLDLDQLAQQVGWLRDDVAQYRDFMRDNDLPFLELAYEDLFGPGVTPEEQRARIREVFAWIGAAEPSAEVWDEIRKLLDPARRKLNSAETYRRIPNADAIEARLGSAENGHLFDEGG
jgi:hypothetical protein